MTTSKLYLFPLTVFLIFPFTFIVTFSTAVSQGHITPWFPYISDTGAISPELCFFTQFLNIAAVFIAITAYIRFKQVEQVSRTTKSGSASMDKLNKVGLIFGCVAGFGVSIVGCFQETHIILGHAIGAFMAFLGGAVFMTIQGFLTFQTMPLFGSKWLGYFRIINGFLSAVLFVIGFATGIISLGHYTGSNWLLWKPEDGGWGLHVTSTTAEWIVAALLDIYFLTFIPEFRRLTFASPEFRIVEMATIHQKGQNGTTTKSQQKVVMQRVEYEERSQLNA